MPRNIRQHVNPFSFLHMDTGAEPLQMPANMRVEVDLGCAAGHYLFRRAKVRPDALIVGVEIRRALVDLINQTSQDLSLSHRVQAHYANLLVDFESLFAGGRVDLITMQFPDPWLKKKHKKRRALTREIAQALPSVLKPGGLFFFQTDVFELALDALYVLDTSASGKDVLRNESGAWRFAKENPTGVSTQRELACKKKERKIWRLLFRRP